MQQQLTKEDAQALREQLGFDLSDAQLELVVAVHQATHRPITEIALMVEAIARGESVTDFVGMTPEVLNAMEQAATVLYRNKRYDEARNIFLSAKFFGEMHGFSRPGATRGIAACDHSQGFFLDAIDNYKLAIELDNNDDISRLALAECLCHTGDGKSGIAMAQQVQKNLEQSNTAQNLLARAKSIVSAGGKMALKDADKRRKNLGPSVAPQVMYPDPQALAAQLETQMDEAVKHQIDNALSAEKTEAQEPVDNPVGSIDEAAEAFAEALMRVTQQEGGSRDADWTPPKGTETLFALPNAIERIDELAELVKQKRLTIREIAAFTPDQMDAAYAVACGHLARGEYQKAAQLAGWLIYIDAREPRYYRLSGLCMQHTKMFSVADHFYGLARIWTAASDPALDIYQGEVALMLGEPERAVDLLSQGVKDAALRPEFAALKARGTALLKQLAAGHFEQASQNDPQHTGAR